MERKRCRSVLPLGMSRISIETLDFSVIENDKKSLGSAQTRQRPTALRRGPGARPLVGVRGNAPRLLYLVETIGIEPTTPCLQSRCSPS